MDIFARKWPAAFLLPLSLPYALITWLRNRLYDSGLMHQCALPCRVVVVGNLTVGGTGKTPMVELIARLLQQRGERVCIISRGYKRTRGGLVVVSDGQRVLAQPHESGDEPFMLANRLKGVPVIVDRDRVRAGRMAIERFSAEVLVLDDAFQYRRLRHDVAIVLVDGRRGFGNCWLLPAGPLRESPQRLASATLVVLTRLSNPADGERWAATVRRFTQAPIIAARHVPQELCSAGGEHAELTALREKPIAAFCGIAQPDSFFALLEQVGAHLVCRFSFPDHHRYSARDLAALTRIALQQGAEWLVTTEKDLARLHGQDSPLPLWCLRITMQVDDQQPLLRAITTRGYHEEGAICCEKNT